MIGKFARIALGSVALIAIAGCATKAPPPPPLPYIVPSQVPPMPTPPLGAATGMYIPQPGIDGLRPTPNRGLPVDESIWHFRSALNVAALNCLDPKELRLAGDYNRFIVVHGKVLDQANRSIDVRFKSRFPGSDGLRVRDTYMTDIYNYFALPPVTNGFCELMLKKAGEVNALPSDQLGAYSVRALGEIDDLFVSFYDAYDRYKRELAAWQAIYGVRGRVTVGDYKPSVPPPTLPPSLQRNPPVSGTPAGPVNGPVAGPPVTR